MRIILAYSAKKKSAKDILEYSTLNPDTNSDSPSVKSKGTRLVSAKAEIKNSLAKLAKQAKSAFGNQFY